MAVNHGGGVGVPLTDYKTVKPYTTTTYSLIATVLPQLSTVSATTTVTVNPDPPAADSPELPDPRLPGQYARRHRLSRLERECTGHCQRRDSIGFSPTKQGS